MRRGFVAAAMAATLVLVGCGGAGVDLDREIEVGGMTLSVPSGWVEDGDDHSYETSEANFGYRTFMEDPDGIESQNAISVSYSNLSLDQTPEEAIVELYGDDAEYELVDETVIDGVQTEIYEFPYKSIVTGEDLKRREAYVYGYDMHYEISVAGDALSMSDVLETVDIS